MKSVIHILKREKSDKSNKTDFNGTEDSVTDFKEKI